MDIFNAKSKCKIQKLKIESRGTLFDFLLFTFYFLITMDILRFITAGSVDDGKSTLIGRLLYDSKNILIDQLEQLEKQSRHKESGEIDLAYLTDGLRAER